MSIKPVIACAVAIAVLAWAQGASAQKTWTVPNGAVAQNVGGVTDYAYGGAYYRPLYDGSGCYYEIVANPA